MGNTLSLAKLFQRKGVIISRLERIKREGSPNFDYILPVTATTVTVTNHIPTQFPLSRKYEPLDFLEVTNNEAVNDITITINNQDAYYCPAGTIRLIHGRGIAVWQVAITNNGVGKTTLGLIRLTHKKEASTIDKRAS